MAELDPIKEKENIRLRLYCSCGACESAANIDYEEMMEMVKNFNDTHGDCE